MAMVMDDIAAVDGSYGMLHVMLSNGDGTFDEHQVVELGLVPEGAFFGELNGDGVLDIVVGNTKDGTVSVFLGKGDGTLLEARTFFVGDHWGTDPGRDLEVCDEILA
jgi:hypothetical protein